VVVLLVILLMFAVFAFASLSWVIEAATGAAHPDEVNCRARRVGHLVRQCRPVAVRYFNYDPDARRRYQRALPLDALPADPAAKPTG
jgi:hypothetical protein